MAEFVQETINNPTVTDSPSPPAVVKLPATTPSNIPEVYQGRFPENLPDRLGLFIGQDGKAYAVMLDAGNPYAMLVGSRALNNVIREIGHQAGHTLRKSDTGDINHFLQAHAETAGISHEVWYRVAPVEGGIEIDLGDEKHTRTRITAGKVEILKEGSETRFYRSLVSLPMAIPTGVTE